MTANSLSRLEASIVCYVIAPLWPLKCCELWLQQTVAKGNNIIEVTERVFTAGYHYSSLWLKATAFESGSNCGIPLQFIVVSLRLLKFVSVVGSVHKMITGCPVQTSKHIWRKYDRRIIMRLQLLKNIPDAIIDNFSHPRSDLRIFNIIREVFG